MKLKVTQENLSKALGYVARIANTRGTLPILANVLLQVEDNRLKIAATNLDIAISCFVGAQIQKPGSLTVPAKLIQDLIAGLPTGVIELEQDGAKLKINTNHYNSIINGVGAEEFPVMPTIDKGLTVSIPASILRDGLQQVVFAASNDESRPVLTGVYLQSIDGELVAVSTDSYRLAEKKLQKTKKDIKILVPATALQDVLRIINDPVTDVDVLCDDQQVRFSVGDTEVVARLIEGTYPDYRKLIPNSFATTAVIKRTEFINITKVASLFARESAGSVVLNVDEPSNSIWVRAVASQLGENNASATVKATGSGVITLNSRYLLEALQAIPSEEVCLGFNGKTEAVLLTDPNKDGYKHIIMPLKS